MNSAANGTPAFAVHDAIALDGDKLKPREDQRKGAVCARLKGDE